MLLGIAADTGHEAGDAAPMTAVTRIAADRSHHDECAVTGGVRLSYAEGAVRFLAALQRDGQTGETTRAELRRLYVRHCADDGLALLPMDRLFAAFAELIGRDRKHERRVPRKDGRRQRTVTYDVPEARKALARRVA